MRLVKMGKESKCSAGRYQNTFQPRGLEKRSALLRNANHFSKWAWELGKKGWSISAWNLTTKDLDFQWRILDFARDMLGDFKDSSALIRNRTVCYFKRNTLTTSWGWMNEWMKRSVSCLNSVVDGWGNYITFLVYFSGFCLQSVFKLRNLIQRVQP